MALMLSVTICYFNNTHQNKVHRTYNRQVCRIIISELKMNNKSNYRRVCVIIYPQCIRYAQIQKR
jgi:hypothetical protein